MIAKKYIDARYASVLFFLVFVRSHLRSFAANSLSVIRRMGYSSRPLISIFRSHNCFRMNTYFARFWPHLSPFRMNTSGSVHSKQLYLPLESTLMKKGGRGDQLLLTRNTKIDFRFRLPHKGPLMTASCRFPHSAPCIRETYVHSASLRHPFLLPSELSTLNFQPSTSFSIRFQLPHQPRNNHLPENHRIGPHFHLPPQVAALRIDPCLLRHVSAIENQVRVRDRNLWVQDSVDHQHRRRRLSEQSLS